MTLLRLFLFSVAGIGSYGCLKYIQYQFEKAYDLAHKDRLDTINTTHARFAKIQALHVYQQERAQAISNAITYNPDDESLHGHAWLYRIYATTFIASVAILSVDIIMYWGTELGV